MKFIKAVIPAGLIAGAMDISGACIAYMLDHNGRFPTKILYKLTTKGIDLIPILVEIIAWSEKYYEVHPQAKAFAKQIRKDKLGLIKMITTNLK